MTDETIELASEPTITVNDDMTVTVETDTHIGKLPKVNPQTQIPWGSAEEAEKFAMEALKKPYFMQEKVDEEETYKSLSFVEFIELVQQAGEMNDEKAIEILATSTKPSIVLLRMKLEKAESIARDNASVMRGLDTLVSESYINEAGKAAILKHWPKA